MAGYRSRVARRKPYISMTNRLKRIAFARERIHKPTVFWRTVIVSDESKFCIFGIKGRKLVWRKPCTRFKNGIQYQDKTR
ncbi:transposable element Tc1 transposase [Trichonephila inaurata madagascariensis]|uniref:Transposable element Tc1 transposase n=1 Tax=Trichonephila inaurata madagascariensis TaxID=2747483 RepID=A0A8X6X1H9_9ARAC|nr:transposable element Tc1 transposase [Trichonephila inaurata madagascariensis]